MKKVWLLYYEKYICKNQYFITEMISEGINYGLDIRLVTVEEINDLIKTEKPKAVISRVINPKLTDCIEKNGIKLFNSASVSRLCNNKADTIRRIHDVGIVHIPTISVTAGTDGKYKYELIECEALQEYNKSLSVMKDSALDMIFYGDALKLQNISDIDLSKYIIKSVTGHGGAEVMLLSDYCKTHAVFGIQEPDAAKYYKDKYIIQPVMTGYDSDIRIYLTGGEIEGAVKRTAKSGFKANYSLGGSISLFEPDDYMTDLVKRILELEDFSYIGIDFLYTDGKIPVFNEIEDVVGARMLSACGKNGYVKKYIEYISRNIL